MNKFTVLVLVMGVVFGFALGRFSAPRALETGEGLVVKQTQEVGDSQTDTQAVEGKRISLTEPTATSEAPQPARSVEPLLAAAVPPRRSVASAARPDTIAGLKDPSEVSRFLDEVKAQNLFDVIRVAKPFEKMNEDLNRLNGRFVGDVKFPDDPDKRWELVLEAHLQIEGKQLKGMTLITMSEKGRTFSQLNGNGPMEDYRSLGGEAGILVKASPDAFFQIYYLPKLDVFAGHYYKQVAPDRVVPKGLVRLERQ